MKASEYLIPGGVVDVESLSARCETRCHVVELRARRLREQLTKARRRLEQAMESRHRRLAVENYERFVERSER